MPSEIDDSHTSVKFQWVLSEYSKLGCEHESHHFALGNLTWKLRIFPRGDNNALDELSLFLVPVDLTLLPCEAEFSFVVKSYSDENHDVKKSEKHQFTDASGHGWHEFMPLSQLPKGYLQCDTLTIEVEVTCLTSEARA